MPVDDIHRPIDDEPAHDERAIRPADQFLAIAQQRKRQLPSIAKAGVAGFRFRVDRHDLRLQLMESLQTPAIRRPEPLN